jgi:hypothetical protein
MLSAEVQLQVRLTDPPRQARRFQPLEHPVAVEDRGVDPEADARIAGIR